MLQVSALGKKLRMKTITIEGMRDAVAKAWSKAIAEKWTEEKTKAYLRVEGVNTTMQNKIWNNAMWSRTYVKTEIASKQSGDYRLLQAMQTEHPELFKCPDTPPMWDIYEPMDVFVFVDAAMHLLFLGTHKVLTKEFVPRWLKENRKLLDKLNYGRQ